MELDEVHLDARQIRVIAHPLRAQLLGALRLDGPATATKLAGALGTNTGATSYHLRQLADAGLVAEDTAAGRGRERWWRAAHRSSSWQRDDFAGDPDATAAADWLDNFALRTLMDRAAAWQRVRGTESPEWREAAGFSDVLLTLNAKQLTSLADDVYAVIERHRLAAAAEPAPDARQVLVYLYGVPVVEQS